MINATSVGHGVEVKLTGDAVGLIEELTAVIRGVKGVFDDTFTEGVSDHLIAYAGKMAFAKEEEKEDITDEIIQVLEENGVVERIG